MFLKTFGWSFFVAGFALIISFIYGGVSALILCAILGVLEVSLSFDNAVVNARILERMSAFWQKIFLTVGVLIAVVGMRILFPLLIVGLTANLNPAQAIDLALQKGDINTEGSYANLLHHAHPQIAAFGGLFLLMIFLDFIFEEREIRWIHFLEKPLARAGRLHGASLIVGLIALLVVSLIAGPGRGDVIIAGIFGLAAYMLVTALGDLFDVDDDDDVDADDIEILVERKTRSKSAAKAVGKAAFMLFVYLEVIDASFSFDGVIGAFAITSDPIVIALGLGLIGALFVRSLTVFLVRKGTLDEYVYLDHGAHWAIGALAVILLITIGVEVNEVITGLIGVVFILTSFFSSVRHNKRTEAPVAPKEVQLTH